MKRQGQNANFRGKVSWRLGIVLFIYLSLATAYSVVTPIGRGADEWAHYWYARFIAEHGRLPANPTERDLAGYKSDWPPLYHLLAAGLTASIETNGPPAFKYRADNVRRQLAPAQGPEAILHTEDELFPWRQEILVWHLGRFLSIILSAGSLLITYLIALEVFEGRAINGRMFSLASVALLAFNPRFLFTGMLFNYDSLMLLLASLFLWLAVRMVKGHYPGWGYWGLGGLAGLALVAKYLAALLPLVVIAVAWKRSLVESSHGRHSSAEAIRRFALRLGQAGLAFVLAAGWWFSYLVITFNEVETYGPVLGILAPLIRGDGSDRTVEALFAWLGGGQTPAPAYIEVQRYTAWRIISELPTTFWGNAVIRPYPLNWFITSMTLVSIAAVIGLMIAIRGSGPVAASTRQPLSNPPQPARDLLFLLIFYSLLPVPFMLARLFGARDALEAVQGRHILFLAGPAVAILLVWGLGVIILRTGSYLSSRRGAKPYLSTVTRYALPIAFYAVAALLLSGAVSQLIFMKQAYPPLLPIQTTAYAGDAEADELLLSTPVTLPGGARVIDYQISPPDLENDRNQPLKSLTVAIIWQAGPQPAPEDYQTELALVDSQGRTRANWRAYQTQARYPTRAWEPGDTIRDEGWLPLVDLEAGDYELRLRIVGQVGPLAEWQTIKIYTLTEAIEESASQPTGETRWFLWQEGQVVRRPPLLYERETAQFTFAGPEKAKLAGEVVDGPGQAAALSPAAAPTSIQVVGPDGVARPPVSAGSRWANFIIGPDWPAGEYYAAGNPGVPLFRVAENGRDFQIGEDIRQPLAVNFENKIKLLGYTLPARRVEPGEGLPLTLYWQGLDWMGEEFAIFTRLLDNQQVVRGGYDRLAQENYSTLLWAPGEMIVDGFAIPVAVDAPDGVYTLSIGWYRKIGADESSSLPVMDPETGKATGVTAVFIGPIKVGGPPPEATVVEANPQNRSNVALGAQIELLGFDLRTLSPDGPEPAPNEPFLISSTQPLALSLYWQASGMPELDYTVFVHIRDREGRTVAQKDSPPLAGTYPTSLWEAGEIIKDRLDIPLDHLPAGRYDLVVGMYDFATGARLAVDGSPDSAVLLGSFQVVEE